MFRSSSHAQRFAAVALAAGSTLILVAGCGSGAQEGSPSSTSAAAGASHSLIPDQAEVSSEVAKTTFITSKEVVGLSVSEAKLKLNLNNPSADKRPVNFDDTPKLTAVPRDQNPSTAGVGDNDLVVTASLMTCPIEGRKGVVHFGVATRGYLTQNPKLESDVRGQSDYYSVELYSLFNIPAADRCLGASYYAK